MCLKREIDFYIFFMACLKDTLLHERSPCNFLVISFSKNKSTGLTPILTGLRNCMFFYPTGKLANFI